jgi:hypothetical protein
MKEIEQKLGIDALDLEQERKKGLGFSVPHEVKKGLELDMPNQEGISSQTHNNEAIRERIRRSI